ncbi:E3 ubiquitin-protein ligase SHPRH-like [Mytilus californianus]|uniref:E3 ubiquitin-protein ligase SHPRH-like n=1 Tax=Mytilus californianus TaxID=6549 RepID=UPI0022459305|nr:E3 ubiquitin-protein ligase SHPRH-like [Mytilus californianus]
MGKRKKAVPKRADEEKRRCMTWNLLDGASGSLSICSDNDSQLLKEQIEARAKSCQPSTSSGVQSQEEYSAVNDSYVQSVLNENLENCVHCVTIQQQLRIKSNEWCKQIATFSLTISEEKPLFELTDDCLSRTEEFWLYVGCDGCESFIYTEENTANGLKKCKFWCISCSLPSEVLGAFAADKIFQLVLERYDQNHQSLDIVVYLRQAALVNMKFACEPLKMKKHSLAVQSIIGHFFGIRQHEYISEFTRKHDIEDLYLSVKKHHGIEKNKYTGEASPDIQHPCLIPSLRPYQKEAVRWMMTQESDTRIYQDKDADLHMLYNVIRLTDGTELYYNKLVGSLTLKKFPVTERLPGGILADEMGLGKTVEVLACIILNPRTDMMETKTDEGEKIQSVNPETLNGSPVEATDQSVDIPSTNNTNNGAFVSSDSVKDISDQTVVNTCSDKTSCLTTQEVVVDNQLSRSESVNGSSLDCVNTSSEVSVSCDKLVETGLDVDQEEQSNQSTPGCELKNDGEISSENSMEDKNTINKLNLGKKGSRKKSTELKEEETEYKNIFDSHKDVGPKEFFECICGTKESKAFKQKDTKSNIQCIQCGLWQHAECVNFDLHDLSRPEFMCPHCLVRNKPLKSCATLIISPSSICHQWVDEILKHIHDQTLKVFVYTGVHKQGFIQPDTLARQDIVITTYETLRKEIDYVDLPHSNSESGRKFRHPKRFMAIPSPLIAVEWWRICLDEAQMVECTTTKTALMALRLTAVNRWCVTGTPIQRSVEDLYGLFLFLGIDPFWVKQWFETVLFKPLCHGVTKPLYDTVSSILWRTAKKDVIEQINIPEQTEHIHWLTFSPVEDHFYRRQYQDCVRDCMKKLSKWADNSTKLSSLDRQTMNQLLYPLLRLRQACCHPQAVRGEFLPLQKSTMTMEELLESLTKKAKTECEEAHRQIVAALNGQAGLHIIKKQYLEAVDGYREVLRSVEEHKEELRTDELQQLHALHNLQEVMALKPKGLEPTLRDGQLSDQANDIRHRYMTRAEAKVTQAQQHLKSVQDNLNQVKDEFAEGSEWWLELIDHAVERGIHEDLVEHIKSDLSDNAGELGPHISIANVFHDTRGLELVLEQRLEALESAREKLMTSLNMLSQGLTPAMMSETVECCLRPVGEISGKCQFCETDQHFQDFESKLYSFTEQGVVMSGDQYQVGTRRQGTWADSQVEKSLKALLSFAKHQRFNRDVISSGVTHIKVFDVMKKEFKGLRAVWMSLREQVSSVDELEMATTRLRLRLPDEAEPTTAQMHIIEPVAIDQHRQKLKADQIVGRCELRKKLGQLLYLKNLAKTQGDNEDGHNPEPCPICQRELGVEWSVMHCGHCYCLDCMRILLDQYSFGGRNRVVKCAICREKTYRSDVSYVSTKKTEDSDDVQNFKVKGSHSTKVQGIVKQMIKIHHKDPEAKILVFSTWTDVLNVLSTALTENNVEHRMLYHGAKFQQNLASFKEDKHITALLLPIQSGSNGLNLIEATYVILVEPILNPAQELQAIGRVHRIGQTRPTEVHRFLVRATIEQKMYSMLKSIETKATSHDTEENSLTIGDITSLLSEEQRDQDQADEEPEEPVQNHAEDVSGQEEVPVQNLAEDSPGQEGEQIQNHGENVPIENVVTEQEVDIDQSLQTPLETIETDEVRENNPTRSEQQVNSFSVNMSSENSVNLESVDNSVTNAQP